MLYQALINRWNTSGKFNRYDWIRYVGWLVVLASFLFYTVSIRYFDFTLDRSAHAWVYLLTAFVGHFSALALFALIITIPVVLLLPYRVLILPLSAALLLGSLFFLVVDASVFRLYRFHLSGFVWEFLITTGTDEIINLSLHTKFIALVVLVAIVVVTWMSVAIAIICTKHASLNGKGKYLLGSWLAVWLISQAMHVWYEANYDLEVAGIDRHLPAYYPTTAKRQLLKLGLIDPDNTRPDHLLSTQKNDSELNYPLNPLACTATDNPKNVLLVVLDALRADMFTPEVMPYLSSLANNKYAHYFSQHLSGGNVTKGGIFSIFYGLPANYWDDFAATATAPLWIRQHQSLGYQTGIFSSATLLSPAFDRTVFASIPELRWHTVGNGSAERDLQTLNDFDAFMDSRDAQKPFFGFLFLDASHNYDVPPGYEKFQPQTSSVDHVKLHSKVDPVPIMNRYKNSLYFLDKQLGALFNKLGQEKDLDNTVVIITSDHGEQFNELGQNYWGHGSNFTRYQVHVPLLVLWPGKAGTVHDYVTSHYDIAPTVLQDVMGCTNDPVDYAIGGNLFDESFPRPWTPVNSYFNYGVLLKDKIVVTYPLGRYEVLGLDNQPLQNQELDGTWIKQLISVLSRYRN